MINPNEIRLKPLGWEAKQLNIDLPHTTKKADELHLNIENTFIDRVSDFTFIGLTINEHLNWKRHIDNLQIPFPKPWVSLTDLNILFLSMIR